MCYYCAMNDTIEKHLDSLRTSGYSLSSVRARRRVLATLPDALNMDREAVQSWWASREMYLPGGGDARVRALASRSGEASHCREFWRWCMQQGIIDRNPADWLPKVRKTKTKTVYVPEADMYRLMREAPNRMRLMLALGAMAGLRSSEIGSITWEDIDRANGVMWVRGGKGGQDRSVPLSGGLLAELGDPTVGIIVGATMTGKAVSIAISRYMRSHDVNLTAHKLRARYATRFLAATGDAIATAEVLGHSDLSSVMRYAVASSDTMRKGAEACGRIG